jgi:hypothetical protein
MFNATLTDTSTRELTKHAMLTRIETLLNRIDVDKKFTRKLPKQHARILRACKIARRDGGVITQGMFAVIARHA